MKKIKSILKPIAFILGCSILFISCSKYETLASEDEMGTVNIPAEIEETIDAVSEGSQMAARGNYSGEDLFNSIFFAHGSFASEIGQFEYVMEAKEDLTVEKIQEINSRLMELDQNITAIDSTFFIDFKTEITSGNHNRILIAFKNTSDFLGENLNQLFPEFAAFIPVVKEDIKNGVINPDDKDGLENYIQNLDTRRDNGEFDGLLDQNIITSGLLGFPIIAVGIAIYFAFIVWNTGAIGMNVYLAMNFWGWKLSSPSWAKKDIMTSPNILDTEMLVNEIAIYRF